MRRIGPSCSVLVVLAVFFAFPAASGAASAPEIKGLHASPVTSTDATLHAKIRPESLETTYQVWIEVPCPGEQECISDDLVKEGSIPATTKIASVEVDLSIALDEIGLEPQTRYSYSVVAENTDGTAKASKSFKTRR